MNNRSLKHLVGERLSRLRGYFKLTREQMAAYLDVHPSTITNYEHGHVLMPLTAFKKLQRAGVNGSFIMGDSEEMLREGHVYNDTLRKITG